MKNAKYWAAITAAGVVLAIIILIVQSPLWKSLFPTQRLELAFVGMVIVWNVISWWLQAVIAAGVSKGIQNAEAQKQNSAQS